MFHRRANRLSEYDYSKSGEYFVTVCVQDFRHVFGFIQDGVMCVSKYGSIVYKQLHWLQERYTYVRVDTMVVMPNHIHLIICIDDFESDESQIDQRPVGTGRDLSLVSLKIKPLSELIGALKTTSSKYIHQAGLSNFQWQRSFYDSIVTSEKAYFRISDYIIRNPLQWETDDYYAHKTGRDLSLQQAETNA